MSTTVEKLEQDDLTERTSDAAITPPRTVAAPRGASGYALAKQCAEECLQESSYLELRRVCCEYHEGVLVLRGRVPTHFIKQVAQTIAARVNGVEQIVNCLEVQ